MGVPQSGLVLLRVVCYSRSMLRWWWSCWVSGAESCGAVERFCRVATVSGAIKCFSVWQIWLERSLTLHISGARGAPRSKTCLYATDHGSLAFYTFITNTKLWIRADQKVDNYPISIGRDVWQTKHQSPSWTKLSSCSKSIGAIRQVILQMVVSHLFSKWAQTGKQQKLATEKKLQESTQTFPVQEVLQ